jgi:uncharacterized protein (TIGR02001 family)
MMAAAAAAAIAAMAAPARAAPAAAAAFVVDLTAGVESTSVFRGYRAQRLNPNPYLGLDLEYAAAYAGLYAGPVAFGEETNVFLYAYGGYAPGLSGVDFDLGLGVYAFPDSRVFEFDVDGDGAADHAGRKGLVEPYAGAERRFGPATLSLFGFFTPETLGESGAASYLRAETEIAGPRGFALVAGYGRSRFKDDRLNDDYDDWSVALEKSVLGFDVRLRYSDTVGAPGPDNRTLALVVERPFRLFSSDGRRASLGEKIRNRFGFDKCRLGAAR